MVIFATAMFFSLIGFAAGAFIMYNKIASEETPVGTLRIDESDPDGDYMFLSLNIPVDKVKAKKQAMLRVEVTHCLPQD